MIDLSLQPAHLQVEAGGTLLATISLRNPALTLTTFQLDIQGLDTTWYTLSPNSLTADEGADAQALFTIHPPAGATGSYEFSVLATSSTQSIDDARIEATLSIGTMPATTVIPAAVATTLIGDARARMLALPRNSLVIAAAVVLLLAAISTFALLKGRNDASTAKPCTTVGTVRGSGCGGLVANYPLASPRATHPGATGTATASSVPGGTFPALILSPTPVLTTEPSLPGSPKYPRQRNARVTHTPANKVASKTPTASPIAAETTPSPIGIDTATATTSVIALVETGTTTPTPSSTPTATMAGSATATDTRTPAPTNTQVNTATPANTDTPSATGTATATDTVTQTPLPSSTPVEIAVRYGYDVSPDTFILKWQTVNAESFSVDGLSGPPNGMRRFPLRSHSFVLAATSRDGAQTKIAVVALVVINDCQARINGVRADVAGPFCRNGELVVAPTPSATHSVTTIRTVTAIRTATATRVTTTPTPTGTGVPNAATGTPGPPTMAKTAVFQADTPITAISTPTP